MTFLPLQCTVLLISLVLDIFLILDININAILMCDIISYRVATLAITFYATVVSVV